MILVDTSVWVDHFRLDDEELAALLNDGEVLTHPFVIGELALGNLPRREQGLALLSRLPRLRAATDGEVFRLVDHHRLFGSGLGFIDAHLLAALTLSRGTVLWTRDRRLANAAGTLGLTTRPGHHA